MIKCLAAVALTVFILWSIYYLVTKGAPDDPD